jgi:hypothetical protein
MSPESDTYVGVLGAVEGVETEVTRLAVAALEHLNNGNEAEQLEESDPHEELLHSALLDGGVMERGHLSITCKFVTDVRIPSSEGGSCCNKKADAATKGVVEVFDDCYYLCVSSVCLGVWSLRNS